jgi:hypothetical protein
MCDRADPARPQVLAPLRRRGRAGLGLLAVGLLLAGACTEGDDDPGSAGPAATAGPTGDAPAPAGTEHPSVESLAAALDAAGHACALEYEGLRDGDKELSLCTVGGEQVTLSIWFEPDQLAAFRDAPAQGSPGLTVIGGNWTVDLADPMLAETLAEDLGGTVRAG